MKQNTCFVIMGFGVKTDLGTGRDIDLDKTYKNIIKPVFEELNFLCFRADEIKHSGVIDIHMYENIIKADFVVADISTLNANAIYELGIRHAVKKHTTLIIAEKELQYPFDISHIAIDSYEHLGKAIDYDEVMRFREHLKSKVIHLINNPQIDSPLYSFMPNLKTPSFNEEEIKEIREEIKDEFSLSEILEEAETARRDNRFADAIPLLEKAAALYPNNEYITQKLTLSTYKSAHPDIYTSLTKAQQILSVLNPSTTTDPETLGLAGAIDKRLYEQTNDSMHLEQSLWFYLRGFYVKQDYYNGINAAFLYTLKSSMTNDKFEAYANFGQGNEIRKRVIKICEELYQDKHFKSRTDIEYIFYTMAEAYAGLSNFELEAVFVKEAEAVSNGNFAKASYSEQRKKLQNAINQFNIKFNLTT